jgi:hypothetical protein
VELSDDGHVRERPNSGFVERREVMEVEKVGAISPSRPEGLDPKRDKVFIGRVIHAGEHAVRTSSAVFVRKLEGGTSDQRLAEPSSGRVVD